MEITIWKLQICCCKEQALRNSVSGSKAFVIKAQERDLLTWERGVCWTEHPESFSKQDICIPGRSLREARIAITHRARSQVQGWASIFYEKTPWALNLRCGNTFSMWTIMEGCFRFWIHELHNITVKKSSPGWFQNVSLDCSLKRRKTSVQLF